MGSCYVPPGCDDEFADIERSIEAASRYNPRWVLTGDFNSLCFVFGDDRQDDLMASALMCCLDSCDAVVHNENGLKTRLS